MKSRLVTVSKSDALYSSYLDGSFSGKERALPVTTRNLNQKIESVTFKVVNKSDLNQKPLSFLLQICRLRLFSLFLFPFLIVVRFGFHRNLSFEIHQIFPVILSLFLIHISSHLIKDYCDHMKGRDRSFGLNGSRLIRDGWMSAVQVKHWSIYLLSFALPLGMVTFIDLKGTQNFLVLGVGSGIIGIAILLMVRSRFLSQFFLTIFFGPLLMLGISLAIFGTVDFQLAVVSILPGVLASFAMRLKDLESIVSDHHQGIRSWAVEKGFDRSKKSICRELFFVSLSAIAVSWSFSSQPYVIYYLIPAICLALFLGLSVMGAQSPLSSSLKNIRYRAVLMHAAFCVALGEVFW